jgi:hypothetical protein
VRLSDANPIEAHPGFLDMLARITGNGVRCILVETANRFACEASPPAPSRALASIDRSTRTHHPCRTNP